MFEIISGVSAAIAASGAYVYTTATVVAHSSGAAIVAVGGSYVGGTLGTVASGAAILSNPFTIAGAAVVAVGTAVAAFAF